MRKLYFLLIMLLAVQAVSAEKISGVVKGIGADDNPAPLAKAKVFWLENSTGVLTGEDGKFEIEYFEGDMLVVSYLGYEPDTLEVESDEFVEINLRPNVKTDEIKVEANKPAMKIDKSSVQATSTITSSGLQKAACCNLAESFVTNASVDVEYTDAVSGARQIKLLGLKGNYSQLMIENIPDMRGIASKYGLAFVPGPWMESIAISKGAASVKNGYESITGQINVEYKKPENDNPYFMNAYGNQRGRMELNFDASQDVGERYSTMLFGHGSVNMTEFDHNGDSFMDMPMTQQVNLLNRWKYIGDKHESVSGINYLFENREGGQIGYHDDANSDLYGIGIKTNRVKLFTKNGFFFESERPRSIGTIVSFTHHDQKSFYGRNDFNAQQNSFYTNLMYQDEVSHGHNLVTGVSMQYDNYIDELNGAAAIDNEIVPGAFAEYTFSGIEDVTLTGGLRADNHNRFGTFVTPRFHAKYDVSDFTSLRLSAGKGYRSPRVIAENSGLLASSRDIIFADDAGLEEAWNYGVSFTTDFSIGYTYFTLNMDYFHTDFMNQTVVDLEQDVNKALIYNVGGSYSNAFQVDLIIEPTANLVITTAYRLNDVKQKFDGELLDKPLQSPHKGFLNIGYDWENIGLLFDVTGEYNSSGRLPNLSGYPEEYRGSATEFDGYFTLYAQITKEIGDFEIYLGGENLTGYRQDNPIIAYNDPFGQYFDSSMIWGPIVGQKIYMGVRLSVY
jgi:outer membrane receptor for ferrienterochelin and colicins